MTHCVSRYYCNQGVTGLHCVCVPSHLILTLQAFLTMIHGAPKSKGVLPEINLHPDFMYDFIWCSVFFQVQLTLKGKMSMFFYGPFESSNSGASLWWQLCTCMGGLWSCLCAAWWERSSASGVTRLGRHLPCVVGYMLAVDDVLHSLQLT